MHALAGSKAVIQLISSVILARHPPNVPCENFFKILSFELADFPFPLRACSSIYRWQATEPAGL